MRYLCLFLISLILFSGCSRKLPTTSAAQLKKQEQKQNSHKKSSLKKSSSPTKKPSKLNSLYSQYHAWKGTPYQYGGLSLKGVDCSGFVLNAYKKVYGIHLPRSTKDQVKKGRIVYKYELQTGDLLFFKTGWNVRHVGIYLEKGKFMHASDSKGVCISSINNPYWKKHYWQTRRLF